MTAGTSGEASAARAGTVLVAHPSADLYGSDRVVLESVRGLVGLGWRVVFTAPEAGPLLDLVEQSGGHTEVVPVPVVRRSMLSPRGLVRLPAQAVRGLAGMRRLVKRVRPDVVLVNTVTLPVWLVAARWCRVPSVVHVHEAESSRSRLARVGLTAPLALGDRVVYNSAVSRNVSGLASVERRGRAEVIHNGVRGPAGAVTARATIDGPIRIVYVGRLSPRKGVDLVVRVVHGLRARGVAARAEIVGAVFPGYEWYEGELRSLVQTLGVDDAITFHGFRSDVWPLLEAADVAAVPSRLEESFGNAVIEALLARRPVVVSDHTGLREAATGFEAAVLTTADDVDAWVAAITTIRAEWSDFRLRAVRDAERAADHFSPDRMHRALGATLSKTAAAGAVDGS